MDVIFMLFFDENGFYFVDILGDGEKVGSGRGREEVGGVEEDAVRAAGLLV
jgi:hypothetical protein